MTAGAAAKSETANAPTPQLTWARGPGNQKPGSRTAVGSWPGTLGFLRITAP
jgi:hypothetical protein